MLYLFLLQPCLEHCSWLGFPLLHPAPLTCTAGPCSPASPLQLSCPQQQQCWVPVCEHPHSGLAETQLVTVTPALAAPNSHYCAQ